MSAQVVKFKPLKGRQDGTSASGPDKASASVRPEPADCEPASHQFWVGASGQRYIHSVHSLLQCPEVPMVTYLMVRRDESGGQIVLAAGRTSDQATSLNLAEIRRMGATLGANEVHVHMLATDARRAKIVEHDLREAHIQGAPQEHPATRH